MFINAEAIYAVLPWKTIREGNFWFTEKKDDGLHTCRSKSYPQDFRNDSWDIPSIKRHIFSGFPHVLFSFSVRFPQTGDHHAGWRKKDYLSRNNTDI